MQAIITKYHSPGNVRGTRYSATAAAGRVYVSEDYDGTAEDSHAAAALAYMEKRGWAGDMIGGHLEDGRMVWVFDDRLSRRVSRKKANA